MSFFKSIIEETKNEVIFLNLFPQLQKYPLPKKDLSKATMKLKLFMKYVMNYKKIISQGNLNLFMQNQWSF